MGGKDSKQAKRMRRLREVLGYAESCKAFAEKLEVSEQRWNNVENGYPISKDLAIIVARKFPWVTTDWLLMEKGDHVPAVYLDQLRQPPSDIDGRRRPRR